MFRRCLRGPRDISALLATLHGVLGEGVGSTLEDRRRQLEASDESAGDVFEAFGRANVAPVADRVQHDSSPAEKAGLLYRLARTLAPTDAVEFGSAFGLSGAYLVAGLQAGGGGRFTTIEAAASRSRIAADTIALAPSDDIDVRLVVGLFDEHFEVLDGAGLVFIDGNHQAVPTATYVEECLRRGARDLVLVLDDIAGYSPEMDQLWQALRRDKRFSATGQFADVGVLVRGDLLR